MLWRELDKLPYNQICYTQTDNKYFANMSLMIWVKSLFRIALENLQNNFSSTFDKVTPKILL